MLWYWALRSAERVLARTGHPAAPSDGVRSRRGSRRRSGSGHGSTRHGRWADYLDARQSKRPRDLRELPRRAWPACTSRCRPACATPCGRHLGNAVHDRVPAPRADRRRRAAAPPSTRCVAPGAPCSTADRAPSGRRARSRATRSRCTGAPFGRSRCHAWAAGPAAILPEAVLGLRPLDDGWSRFTVRPDLGDLEWAAAVVPAPSRRHRRRRRPRARHRAGAARRRAGARWPRGAGALRGRVGTAPLGGHRRGTAGLAASGA